MSKRIVIALGGNALGNTAAEQLQLVTETAKSIVDLSAAGNDVVGAHGNGPQVGMINLGLSTAAESGALQGDMPFPECGAMSEGYIGYHLQQAIGNELTSRGMDKPVATIVTQTVVSKDDPAFQNPTKPVGAFYDKETADRIATLGGTPDGRADAITRNRTWKPFDVDGRAGTEKYLEALIVYYDAFIADDRSAVVGTINLDYRSLYHHFENGCFLADCDAVLEIRDDLIRTMGESREETEQYKEGRSAGLRLGQLILRLFAELL